MSERLRTLSMSMIGVSLGIVGTLLLSAIDPLSLPVRAATPIAEVSAEGALLETFHGDAPRDVLAATNGGELPIPPYPQGVSVLDDAQLRQGFVLLTKLRDKQGTVVGFASEHSERRGTRRGRSSPPSDPHLTHADTSLAERVSSGASPGPSSKSPTSSASA